MTQLAQPVWPPLQSLLRDLRIEPLLTDPQIERAAELLNKHHHLGAPNPVDERLWYAAIAPDGEWLGVLLTWLAHHAAKRSLEAFAKTSRKPNSKHSACAAFHLPLCHAGDPSRKPNSRHSACAATARAAATPRPTRPPSVA